MTTHPPNTDKIPLVLQPLLYMVEQHKISPLKIKVHRSTQKENSACNKSLAASYIMEGLLI